MICLGRAAPKWGSWSATTSRPSPFRSVALQRGTAILLDVPKPVHDVAEVQRLRRELARQKRAFDFAMVASDMGTWRYTLADNVCLYDENEQRLYG
jgi:hypothetical protein